MWVDYDVPNCFPTLNNFYGSPFSKWPPQYHKISTLSDIITCGIVVAILKMASGRNCSMSGINSGHHYLPTYQFSPAMGNRTTAKVDDCYPFRMYEISTFP
jgi:hypothetical protein